MPRIISRYKDHKSGATDEFRLVRYGGAALTGVKTYWLTLDRLLGKDSMGAERWDAVHSNVPSEIHHAGKDGGNMEHRFMRWLSSTVPVCVREKDSPDRPDGYDDEL